MDHGECAESKPVTVVWGRNLIWFQGQSPMVRVRGQPESFFFYFYTKEGPKVKDL